MVSPALGRLRTSVFLTLTLVLVAAGTLRAGPRGSVTTVDGPSTAVSATPSVHPETVPATGRQHVDIEIPRFGRYAIMATGGSGSAITLVDRLAGPIATDGEAGLRQGRINAVLEPGAYRVRLESPRDGIGAVRLEIRPYAEQNTTARELLDGTQETTTLSDLEERSWWVRTDGAGPLHLDAAGRSLTDLRLWRDGTWATDARPACDTLADIDGNKLGRCTLDARLQAGLYRVVATGGPARPRGDGDGAEPLWVRLGIPTLSEGSRPRRTLSPFGFDRYLVASGGAARLTLGSPGLVNMDARAWRPTGLASSPSARASVPADARVMAAEIRVGTGKQVVTVQGTPGQPYQLQLYQPVSGAVRVNTPVPVWVSSLPAAEPGDELDQTAIVVQRGKATEPSELVAASAVPLSSQRAWRRRFNLRGPSSLYVDIQTPGTWRFEAKDVKIRVAPPQTGASVPGYKLPDPQPEVVVVELAAGLQKVDLIPDEARVVELVMRLEGSEVPTDLTPPRVAARFPELSPVKGKELNVLLAPISGVGTALVQRNLPVTMHLPLPLVLGPSEIVEIPAQFLTFPVSANETVALVADVPGVLLSLDEGDAVPSVRLGAPTRRLRVHNRSDQPVFTTIGPAPTPPTPTPPEQLVPEEDGLPLVRVDEAIFADLEEGANAVWRVRVPESGFWRLESAGLLSLMGALSDRAGQEQGRAATNGPGRNFRIDAELARGDALLSVQGRGRSAGRYGLRLTRLPERDGGALRPDLPAWAELPAGNALRFQVEITEKGRYTLSTLAPGQNVVLRLADADGWPLFAAGTPLTDLELSPGRYALTLLPTSGDALVRAELTRLDPPALPEGHGPFPLALGRLAEHTWWEPAGVTKDGPRPPDVWTFTLPARVETRVALSPGMEARLVPATGAPIEGVRGGWKGTLEAGSWRLEASAQIIDNGIPYSVRVDPVPLVAGAEATLTAPGTLHLVVGEPGLYTLSSVSDGDVRATLLDSRGEVVFVADDRPGAWDFARSIQLLPGRYRLELRPVGSGGRAHARVAMQRQEPTDRGATKPGIWTSQPSRSGDAWTVTLAEDELLVASAESVENLGVALDRAQGDGWTTLTADQGPAPWVAARGPASLRLRVWSLDGRGVPATVRLASGRPKSGESALVIPGDDAPRLAFAEGWGELLTYSGSLTPRLCAGPGGACLPIAAETLAPGDSAVWAVALNHDAAKVALRLSPSTLGPERAVAVLPGAILQRKSERGYSLIAATSAVEAPRLTCPASPCFPAVSVEAAGGRSVLLVPSDQLVQLAARSDGDAPLPVRASSRRFERIEEIATTLPWSGRIPAGGALALSLAQVSPLSLTLSPGLVLRAERDGRAEVLSADGEGLQATLSAGASRLVVVNPSSSEAALSLRAAPPLDARGELVQLLAESAGLLVLEQQGAGTLHLGGAGRALIASGAGGVHEGERAELGDGDWSVRVTHAAGPLVLWRERPGALASALLSGGATPVNLPTRTGRVPLSGEVVTVALPAGEATPLTLRAPGAAAVILTGADGRSELRFPDETGRFDLLARPEGQNVTLRALGGVPLWGEASFEAIPQGTLPTEGAGEPHLLAPGERRAFAVSLPRETTVALGVRATPETARILVLGPQGAVLEEGLVAQLTLPVGESWLIVAADAQGGPVNVRPVIAGRSPPGSRAPPEVVRGYAAAAGRIPELPAEGSGENYSEDYSEDTGAYDMGNEDTGETDTGGGF